MNFNKLNSHSIRVTQAFIPSIRSLDSDRSSSSSPDIVRSSKIKLKSRKRKGIYFLNTIKNGTYNFSYQKRAKLKFENSFNDTEIISGREAIVRSVIFLEYMFSKRNSCKRDVED